MKAAVGCAGSRQSTLLAEGDYFSGGARIQALSFSSLALIPSLLGTLFNPAVITVFALCLLFTGKDITRGWSTRIILPAIASLLMVGYIAAQLFMTFTTVAEIPFNNVAGTIGLALLGMAGGKVLSTGRNLSAFIRFYVWSMVWLCIPGILTLALCLVQQTAPAELYTFKLPGDLLSGSAGYDWILNFPLTVSLGTVTWFGIVLPRACGAFREPGIFQLFIITAFFGIDFIPRRYTTLARALLLCGLLTTFSTIGIPLFFLILAYRVVVGKHVSLFKSLTVAGCVLCAYLVLSFDPLEVRAKTVTNYNTDASRISAISGSLDKLYVAPIAGTGVFAAKQLTFGSEGISFLSSLHSLGLCGIACYCLLMALSIGCNYNRQSVLLLLPLLATLLVAQPLYLSPVAFMFFNLDCKNIAIGSFSKYSNAVRMRRVPQTEGY